MASLDLQEYIVIQILSWLPVKSILRFKCVCKVWFGIIENFSFIEEHLNHAIFRSNENDGLLVKRRLGMDDPDSFIMLCTKTFEACTNIDLSYLKDDWRVDLEMLASCNGVVCIQNKRYKELALWNPATKQLKTLPDSCIPPPLGLKFNGSDTGFGFDIKSNDYKVVRIISYSDDDGQWLIHQVEVYSLITDSWKQVDVVIPVSHIMPNPPLKTYVNGIYYWRAKYNVLNEILLSFDMSEEIFRTTPLPHVCTVSTYASYRKNFAVLNGSIALILFPQSKVKSFDIWVLNEYGLKGSWSKLYTIGPVTGWAWPLGFCREGNLLLEIQQQPILLINGDLCLVDRGQLVLCDPVTQQFKNLPVEGQPGSLEVLVYNESPVSINKKVV